MRGTMVETLGIRLLPNAEEGEVRCAMPISAATRQYFGILHGGASLALAETLAGVGSLTLTAFDPARLICGVQVSGNHLAMSPARGEVHGRATLLHAGRSTHVWNVDVTAPDGTLISTARVTNRIVDRDKVSGGRDKTKSNQ